LFCCADFDDCPDESGVSCTEIAGFVSFVVLTQTDRKGTTDPELGSQGGDMLANHDAVRSQSAGLGAVAVRDRLRPLAHLLTLDRISIPAIAFMLVVAHVGFVLLATAQRSPAASYRSLLEWDAVWYATIVDNGYLADVELRGQTYYGFNCGFFPGLPVLAWPLKVLGLPTWLALPLVSQCCAWGFWIYVLLLMRRWGVHARHQAFLVAALVLYPWSFFLETGYSESPFLMFLTGYLYWSEGSDRKSWWLAALHGIGMTGTRLVGLPVVGWPVLRAWFGAASPWRMPLAWLRQFRWSLVLAGAAAFGMVFFYAYLGWRFGRMDLYHLAQEKVMNVRPDYLPFLRWDFYIPKYTYGLVCPFIFFGGAWLLWRERGLPAAGSGNRGLTYSLIAIAGMMYYLAMASMIDRQLGSLARIGFPSIVLLALAWCAQSARLPLRPVAPTRRWLHVALLSAASVGLLVLQVYFVQRFIHRQWVA
jgi:hypothetical protein